MLRTCWHSLGWLCLAFLHSRVNDSLFPDNIRLFQKIFAPPQSFSRVLRTCWHSLGWLGEALRRFHVDTHCFRIIFGYEEKNSSLHNLSPGGFAPIGTSWVGWVERFGVPTLISVVSRKYSPISEIIRPSQVSPASHVGTPYVGWVKRFGVATSILIVSG